MYYAWACKENILNYAGVNNTKNGKSGVVNLSNLFGTLRASWFEMIMGYKSRDHLIHVSHERRIENDLASDFCRYQRIYEPLHQILPCLCSRNFQFRPKVQ